jgi:hypothetical protein
MKESNHTQFRRKWFSVTKTGRPKTENTSSPMPAQWVLIAKNRLPKTLNMGWRDKRMEQQ